MGWWELLWRNFENVFPCECFCYLAVDRYMESRMIPFMGHFLYKYRLPSGLQKQTPTTGISSLPVLFIAKGVCVAIKQRCTQGTSATQCTVLPPSRAWASVLCKMPNLRQLKGNDWKDKHFLFLHSPRLCYYSQLWLPELPSPRILSQCESKLPKFSIYLIE